MLVFGVHSLSQLENGAHLGVLGERKEIALDLYDECSQLPDDERNALQEAVLRNASSATAAFKRTQARRFEEFDKKVSDVLSENRNSFESPVSVHDIGISDGRTTTQFYRILDRIFNGEFHLTASDLDIQFFSLSLGKRQRGIFDGHGTCLQLVFPPFVFSLRAKPRSRYAVFNNIISKSLDLLFAEKLGRKLHENRQDARAFATTCKEFADLKRDSSNVTLNQYDVLQPLYKRCFQVVRAMNVLNQSYFGDQGLATAVANIHASLIPGGMLVTGSNQDADSEVMGGIYIKSGPAFKAIEEWDGGSPIRDLLLRRPT